MKNKSLIIILSILAFIVLVVVLSSTVFCLNSVKVNFLSNTINLTNQEQTIIDSGNFTYKKSIFFLNKEKFKENIEINNPYAKVVSIETIFPNKLVVNVVERNELFVVKNYDSSTSSFKNYAILDNELKVLKVENDYTNTHLNPILVEIEGDNFYDLTLGHSLNNSYKTLLDNLAVELLAYNNNPVMLKANFESIILNFSTNEDVFIKMRSGVEIILKEGNVRLTEKFMLALSYYNGLEDKTMGRITTYVNNEDKVVGYFI